MLLVTTYQPSHYLIVDLIVEDTLKLKKPMKSLAYSLKLAEREQINLGTCSAGTVASLMVANTGINPRGCTGRRLNRFALNMMLLQRVA